VDHDPAYMLELGALVVITGAVSAAVYAVLLGSLLPMYPGPTGYLRAFIPLGADALAGSAVAWAVMHRGVSAWLRVPLAAVAVGFIVYALHAELVAASAAPGVAQRARVEAAIKRRCASARSPSRRRRITRARPRSCSASTTKHSHALRKLNASTAPKRITTRRWRMLGPRPQGRRTFPGCCHGSQLPRFGLPAATRGVRSRGAQAGTPGGCVMSQGPEYLAVSGPDTRRRITRSS
jgi:hypothetical protein